MFVWESGFEYAACLHFSIGIASTSPDTVNCFYSFFSFVARQVVFNLIWLQSKGPGAYLATFSTSFFSSQDAPCVQSVTTSSAVPANASEPQQTTLLAVITVNAFDLIFCSSSCYTLN